MKIQHWRPLIESMSQQDTACTTKSPLHLEKPNKWLEGKGMERLFPLSSNALKGKRDTPDWLWRLRIGNRCPQDMASRTKSFLRLQPAKRCLVDKVWELMSPPNKKSLPGKTDTPSY